MRPCTHNDMHSNTHLVLTACLRRCLASLRPAVTHTAKVKVGDDCDSVLSACGSAWHRLVFTSVSLRLPVAANVSAVRETEIKCVLLPLL